MTPATDTRRPSWLGAALLGVAAVPMALAVLSLARAPQEWLPLLPFSGAALAALAAARHTWREATPASSALAFSLLLALVPVALLSWPEALGRATASVAAGSGALAAAFGLTFAAHFPVPRPDLAPWGGVVFGLSALSAAAAGILALTGAAATWALLPTGVGLLWSALAPLLLLYTSRRAPRVSVRWAARWLLLCFALSALLALPALAGAMTGGGWEPGALLALALLPMAWGGYRALRGVPPRELSRISRRTAGAALTTATLAAAGAVVILSAGGASWLAGAALGCAAALLAAPIRERIEGLMEARARRGLRRLRDVTGDLTETARLPQQMEIASVLLALREALSALRVTLLLPDGRRWESAAEGLPGAPRRVWRPEIEEHLRAASGPAFADDPAGEEAFEALRSVTADKEAQGFVPLWRGGALCGALVLSQKEWGRHYTIDEIDLLGVAGYAFARLVPEPHPVLLSPPARESSPEVTPTEVAPPAETEPPTTEVAPPAELPPEPVAQAAVEPLPPERSAEERPPPALVCPEPTLRPPPLFAESDAMRTARAAVLARAPLLLLAGERATGRELLARHWHQARTAGRTPFVRLSPVGRGDLELAELLAKSAREAAGGTLHVAELERLGPLSQAALLGLVEDLCDLGLCLSAAVTPAGLAAPTLSRDVVRRLEPAVRVPPLRDRVADFPVLVSFLLGELARERGPVSLSDDALYTLVTYRWPGNVAELRAVLGRALSLTEGDVLGPASLLLAAPPPLDPFVGTYEEIELRALAEVLRRAGGNKSLAARRLGMKRTTFLERLKRMERAAGMRPQ
jgi:hypothetical protein